MSHSATTHLAAPAPVMSTAVWARLAALSVLWAGSFLFYKVLATELPPLTTVLSRVLLGALLLAAWLPLSGVSLRIPRAQWGRLLTLATLNNVIPFTFFAWGETRVASGTAAILNAMTPIFTLLVAALVLRTERLTAARATGVACGFAGVATLVGPGVLLGQDIAGQLACLLAALSYGFGVPSGRRITGLLPQQVAFGQLTASAAILVVPVAVLDHPWTLPAPDAAGWASILGLAALSTALGYVLFFQILARAGATNLSLVTFLIPVTSLILGAALLHEPVTLPALAGMTLIAAGLAAIDGRLLRLVSTRPSPR